jgi:hypothetical protein
MSAITVLSSSTSTGTPFPIMLPANNQIAIVDPVPMRQEISAFKLELSLYQLAAAALR